MNRIILPRFFLPHVHLREYMMMQIVAPMIIDNQLFSGATAMGNFSIPIETAMQALNYKGMAYAYAGLNKITDFDLIIPIMLTRNTTKKIIRDAFDRGIRFIKFLPDQVSTNAGSGVTLADTDFYFPLLQYAQELGMIVLIHAELGIDKYGKAIRSEDREAKAIPLIKKINKTFPYLIIIIEHVSTKAMVDFVNRSKNVFASVTVQHLLLTIEDVKNPDGTIKTPENFCLPIVKTRKDRDAILREVLYGNPKFFFAPDFAPHPWEQKTIQNPKAGVAVLPLEMISEVVEIFNRYNAWDKLPNFISVFGRSVYGLELDKKTISLVRNPWIIPKHELIANFKHGQTTNWTVLRT